MKYGQAFTPDGPLTLGDIRHIAEHTLGDDNQIVECRTPMGPDRRQVTLTVTTDRWDPPNAAAAQQETNTEGERSNG